MGTTEKAPKKGAKVAGYVVWDVGVKIGGMVYAPVAVVPKELVTDEVAAFLVEATGEEVSEEGETGESL